MQVLANTGMAIEPSSTIGIVAPPADQENKIKQLKASVSKSEDFEVFRADLTVQKTSTLAQDKLVVQGVIGNSSTMSISIEFNSL